MFAKRHVVPPLSILDNVVGFFLRRINAVRAKARMIGVTLTWPEGQGYSVLELHWQRILFVNNSERITAVFRPRLFKFRIGIAGNSQPRRVPHPQ
jgi:hypothetical protein